MRISIRGMMAAVAVVALGLGAFGLVGQAREEARRRQCEQNLKWIGLACHNYVSAFDAFPPGTTAGRPLPPERRFGLFVLLLGSGYVEQLPGELALDWNSAWDQGENRDPQIWVLNWDEPPEKRPPPYKHRLGEQRWLMCPCNPSRGKPGWPGVSHYVGSGGLGVDGPTLPASHPRAGVFGYDRATTLAEIKDGTAATMTIAETALNNGPWTAGGPATVRGLDPARRPYIGPGRQLGGSHRGGALVLFADGSVRFVAEDADPRILEAAATIAGGEDVGAAR